MARWASWVHKWLALLMAIQILFWFVSGLFFAVVPIETVRSEHSIVEAPPQAIDLAAVAPRLAALPANGRTNAVELRTLMGRPVAVLIAADDHRTLYDLDSGRQISPIPELLAREIAESHLAGDARAVDARLVERGSPEYRGALPAWRIDFAQASRAVYVAADTGEVTARRSTLWRTYDFLWSLHIMDFKDHEDFNTPLLIAATVLGLVIVISGFIMFPSRLGYHRWRRRRRRRRANRIQ